MQTELWKFAQPNVANKLARREIGVRALAKSKIFQESRIEQEATTMESIASIFY